MPLLWLSLAYLAGLIIGAAAPGSMAIFWPLLTGGGLLAWLVFARLSDKRSLSARSASRAAYWLAVRHPRLRVPPLLLVVCLAVGAWQASAAQSAAANSPLAALNGHGPFRLIGMVSAPPDLREDSTTLRISLRSAAAISATGKPGTAQPIRGTLLVLLPERVETWQYGDLLQIDGKPNAPPDLGSFSYRDALARQGIYSQVIYPRVQRLRTGAGNPLLAAIYSLRRLAYAKTYALFPAPEAPLLAGILLGMDNDLTLEMQRAFRDTGTSHIIAISGFNIAILAALCSGLFQRLLSRWWAAGLAALTIGFYTLMVGAQPSVVRAAIMGSLGLLSALVGRRAAGLSGLNILAFTAALMCLTNPLLPQDASFQLSFGATLGLMLYAEPLQSGFQRLAALRIGLPAARRLAGPVGEYILFTLAAQFTTLPIIAFHFQRLSLISLLANPLVLPAQPLLMLTSGAAVLAGLIYDPLGRLLAGLAWPFSAYTLRVVETLSSLPGSSFSLAAIDATAAWLLGLLVLSPFFLSLAPQSLRTAISAQVRPAAALVTAALLAVVGMRAAVTRPDNHLHLSLFNQEGQAVLLLQSPSGAYTLIGSAAGSDQLSTALGRRLPAGHSLDVVLLNQCEPAALTGLPVLLERFPVQAAWWACLPPEDRLGRQIATAFQTQSLHESTLLPVGSGLDITGINLQVLAKRPNSAALWFTWQQLRILQPGGLSPQGLSTRVYQPGLLLLDSGDLKRTSPTEWEALRAQVVIAAVGSKPNSDLPARWIRVAPGGWAAVTSDGQQLWLEENGH